jgi:outer membrane protein assembly factor BamB
MRKVFRGPCRDAFHRVPLFTLAFTVCLVVANLRAADALITGTASGKILASGNRRVMLLSPSGEVLWQHPTALTHDAWMLPNGNVLFADAVSVTEITPEKKVAFQYKSAEQKGGGAFSCQRLTNGNTLIGENSTGKVLEIDTNNAVVFSLQTEPFTPGQHHNLRMVRKLENGNYLVCHSGISTVKEYTPAGQVVWQSKEPGAKAFAAIRTPKNTTLVSSLDQIIEYDNTGKKIWECSTRDLSVPVNNMTGMHLLSNGNIVIGCYSAYKNGEGCGLLEITRERKVVWRYSNPKADNSMMSVELLSPDGKPLSDPCLR